MSIRYTAGRWDLSKRPVVYEFDVRLECGVCLRVEGFLFESRPVEGASFANGDYPGTWRKLEIHGGHADPLRPDIVVCSRRCAVNAADDYINGLYA